MPLLIDPASWFTVPLNGLENNTPTPTVPLILPVLVSVTGPPLILIPIFWPEIVPELMKVPPPLPMMPIACRLTMLPLFVKVTALEINAPSAPTPLTVIDPEFVIGPSVVPSDVIPWASTPELVSDPLLLIELLLPLANIGLAF